LRCLLSEELDLLLAVSLLVVQSAFVDVLLTVLQHFLEYPELELSNSLADNSMRPVVLGRKNWVHIGSSQAGPKIAAILSVVESCRRLKHPVPDYLAAVLSGLADLPIRRLLALVPSA
jgi:transposase